MEFEELENDTLMQAFTDWNESGGCYAVCTKCGAESWVEPDAESYNCGECDSKGTVTSPLVFAGMI